MAGAYLKNYETRTAYFEAEFRVLDYSAKPYTVALGPRRWQRQGTAAYPWDLIGPFCKDNFTQNATTAKKLSKDRTNFRGPLTPAEVKSLAVDKDLAVLQASSFVDLGTWEQLNAQLFSVRPDIELRVYGFYGTSCDLSFLGKLSNIRRFSADCLSEAINADHVVRLPNLESLGLGIRNLEDFGFLHDLDASKLKHLFLSATSSKKPSLRVLEHFPLIETLYIEGHNRDIESIGQLSRLHDLTLRSITVSSLVFLENLKRLVSLNIKLGGTSNLSSLQFLKSIKYLELWQVRGLTDLAPISEMVGLQFLFLQALRNVTHLPNFSKLAGLRRVYLENMKGLSDISSLELAPALEELIHVSAQGIEPSQYAGLIERRKLKRIFVGFGNIRKNNEIVDLAASNGIEFASGSVFRFM